MATLLNGELSNGCLNKRQLEIGNHPSGSTPKYKHRKVSAIRDFPPGCGPNARLGNSDDKDHVVMPAGGENMGKDVKANGETSFAVQTMPQSLEAVKNTGHDGANESLDNLVENAVAIAIDGIMNGDEEIKIDGQPLVFPISKGNEYNAIYGANDMNKTEAQIKEFREVEGLLAGNGVVEGGKPPAESLVTDSMTFKKISTSTLKDKFRRRRVSAIRDFPPLCGPNAPHEPKDIFQKVNFSNMSLVEVPIGMEKSDAISTLDDGMEIGPLGRTSSLDMVNYTEATAMANSEGIALIRAETSGIGNLAGGLHDGEFVKSELKEVVSPKVEILNSANNTNKDNGEVVGKEVVLYLQDNSDTSMPLDDALNIIGEVPREIVHGPMVAPNCPWTQRKEKVLHSQVSDVSRPSNSIMNIKAEVSMTTRNTIGEVSREIVHGLMAAPYCPWRHGKSVLSNSTSRTTDDKFKKANVYWRKRSKVVARKSIQARGSLENSQSSSTSDTIDGSLGAMIGRTSEDEVKKNKVGWRKRTKAVAKKSVPTTKFSRRKLANGESCSASEAVNESPGAMIVKYESPGALIVEDGTPGAKIVKDDGGCVALYVEPLVASPLPLNEGRRNFDVSLPPFGPNSSNPSVARNRVRETLRLFQAICRKLLQGEEAKLGPEVDGITKQSEKYAKRIDLQAARIIKDKGKEVNTSINQIGAIPGVEVGDEFQYRVELAIIGVHRLYQAGIDYVKSHGMLLCTSIVASGAYADDMENAEVLIYSGQGGNLVGKNKNPEDQKLERGNLALKNSISERNPVRVIRGSKEMRASDSSDAKDKIVTTYVYDGLYTVERYWRETGKHGKMIFMFELRRIPGQPELAWKEVKLSKKSKKRQGVCVDDISDGKETLPICAVNTIDNEKPPIFTYITKMIYPDWFNPIPLKGCDCIGRCSDSRKCLCAVKNGGEIPYNYNGAIVEAKPLVYECGPSCKCPPSCYNRVSQRGPKIKLEIFKTNLRGWGVRSLSFIPSGSFVCEYVGEVLEDKEAEQRTGNDEYLFDIGRNCNDSSSKLDEVDSVDVAEDGIYTIDAAQYGNIGRFINHSCSPNLYAQDVLYDHEDTSIPHIMLFAAENIPALQELTYHYNYSIDQIRDSSGNIKMKSCYCGSTECTGRMY